MNLLLIGCGRLGRLFLELWASNEKIGKIWVIQPSLSAQSSFNGRSNIHFARAALEVPEDFAPEAVIIAIKPQKIPEALPAYQRYHETSTFISLASSVPISTLKKYLGQETIIARVMPNIAIKAHASLNLVFMPEDSLPHKKQLIETICENTGSLMWLSDEKKLDELTIITGCGPAYFYLLMEALIKSAIKHCKVDEKDALSMVKHVFIGSALLINEAEEITPEALRLQVTSKGGMTEAAIEALQPPLLSGMDAAVQRGMERMKELTP